MNAIEMTVNFLDPSDTRLKIAPGSHHSVIPAKAQTRRSVLIPGSAGVPPAGLEERAGRQRSQGG
ncbi:hypothetical protein AGMMS50256_23530 [Betaproteobacteria bacterium]|nr:hypothetical protein AGMMS50256_23530 [Betaproteobacteria bacterium]